MRLLPRRIMVLTVAMVMTVAGTVALTGSAASASPIFNSVRQTAFIWNCPTGVAGCSAEQTRVGDIRTTDPMTDVCRVNNNPLNLAYNRTNRAGAAKRTGFLYRTNLNNQNLMDSCTTGGVPASAPAGTEQRLCPFLACGGVAVSHANQTLRAFCSVDNDNTTFYLTVAFYGNTGGPLTAGFMDGDDMNGGGPGLLLSCETLFI